MSLPEIAEGGAKRGAKSASAFRTISEVATELEVPPHVLRFWESRFPQIRPLKRGGGRRYYRPEDVDLLRRIRELLYRDGYTIKGVQKLLRLPGARPVDEPDDDRAAAEAALEAEGFDAEDEVIEEPAPVTTSRRVSRAPAARAQPREAVEEPAPTLFPLPNATARPARSIPVLAPALAEAEIERLESDPNLRAEPRIREGISAVIVELDGIRRLLLSALPD